MILKAHPKYINKSPKHFIEGDFFLKEKKLTLIFTLPDQLIEEFRFNLSSPKIGKELYKDNCLEFFIGLNKSKEYLEFNFSPKGQYTIFYFQNYRTLSKEIENIIPVINLNKTKVTIEIEVKEFDLDCSRYNFSLVNRRNNELHYYAIKHLGESPDFHLF